MRSTILCVDDEPNVLEGLALHLRRRFDVATATSGELGLAYLEEDGDVAVIVSDQRMPGMDGTEFLAAARRLVPDATRILLTGQADVDSAIRAINDGNVYRFLTKPCPPAQLTAAVVSAEHQHKLVTAERELLEQTLRGSIQAMIDVLALTSPECFGRANRIKELSLDLAEVLGVDGGWSLEVAAMLSQLGFVALPPDVVEKVYFGRPLTAEETRMVARVPAITEQLLQHIPRLDTVRSTLAAYPRPFRRTLTDTPDPSVVDRGVDRSAQILKAAIDFDTLEASGDDPHLAVDTMRSRPDRYDPKVVEALSHLKGAGRGVEIRDLPISGLRSGMVLADDVKSSAGTLLLARGYEVTAGFLERARHFRPGMVKEPVRVIVKRNNKDRMLAKGSPG